MSPEDPRHHSNAGYVAGCRTDCCRAARRTYMADRAKNPLAVERDRRLERQHKNHARRAAAAGLEVGAAESRPVQDHVRRLMRLGWSSQAIADMHGSITREAVRQLADDSRAYVKRNSARLTEIPYTAAVPASVGDRTFVPALGVHRRREALIAIGWTNVGIRDHMRRLTGHNFPQPQDLRVMAFKWRAMDAVFEELCMTPGPSAQSRARADRLGYVPPLAWDDIDDPDEKPRGVGRGTDETRRKIDVDEVVVMRFLAGEDLPLTTAEKFAVMNQWLAAGNSERSMTERTGWKDGRYVGVYKPTLQTVRRGQRFDLPDDEEQGEAA